MSASHWQQVKLTEIKKGPQIAPYGVADYTDF
jgi:hypothetical protein